MELFSARKRMLQIMTIACAAAWVFLLIGAFAFLWLVYVDVIDANALISNGLKPVDPRTIYPQGLQLLFMMAVLRFFGNKIRSSKALLAEQMAKSADLDSTADSASAASTTDTADPSDESHKH